VKLSKLRNAFLLGLSTVVLTVSSFGNYVSAAAAKTTPPVNIASNNANTLKISPVRTDLTVKPGESAKVSVYVTNVTTAPILLKPIENDFVAGDEKGTPSIILDENSYAPTHSLKRFMKPIQDVQVAAGATQQVDVTVSVPKDAQAGGYFGALRFTPASNDGSRSVNLSASVASLILMTVPGDLLEILDMTNFDVQQDGGAATNFRSGKDLELLMRFKNAGNVQSAPFGQINVLKSGKTVYSYNFNGNDPKETILPDSARKWTIPLKNIGNFGKYTIKGNFTYGTKSQSIDIEKTIWIVPTLYIVIGASLLIGLIALILFIVLFLKSYKKRILRKSRRR
jgi:hypothetical protein